MDFKAPPPAYDATPNRFTFPVRLASLGGEEVGAPTCHKGLEDNEKGILLFIGIYSAVVAIIALVFSLDTYPDFKDDKRFSNEPFTTMMMMASVSLFTTFVVALRLCKNMGDEDVPWWLHTIGGISAIVVNVVWIWNIVILDSGDADILEDDYIKIYNFILITVCIFGGIYALFAFFGLCACGCMICDKICS